MESANIKKILDLPYTVKLIKEEDIFYTEVEEIPGCWSEGATVEEAYSNIRSAMKLWMETAIERNMQIPIPKTEEKEYSGKIVVRMPKELHKILSQRAEKEEISLNQFMLYLLSSNFYLYDVKHETKDLNHNRVLCDPIRSKYGSRSRNKEREAR